MSQPKHPDSPREHHCTHCCAQAHLASTHCCIQLGIKVRIVPLTPLRLCLFVSFLFFVVVKGTAMSEVSVREGKCERERERVSGGGSVNRSCLNDGFGGYFGAAVVAKGMASQLPVTLDGVAHAPTRTGAHEE